MGQIFEKTRDQMNNWMWDNPRDFADQVDHSNSQSTSSGKVNQTCEHFSSCSRDDLWGKIALPSCRKYKPGDILAVRTLNWDAIIEEDADDENWADPGAPSGERSCLGAGNVNDNGKGEENTLGGEKGTGEKKGTQDCKGKGKATEDGKGKGQGKGNGHWKGKATEEWKGKGKGNGKGKFIVQQTPGGEDISRASGLQLQKEMYEADLDTEG